jgi:hypothetical protein
VLDWKHSTPQPFVRNECRTTSSSIILYYLKVIYPPMNPFKSKAFTFLAIYIGTIFYITASYLHLRLGDSWTFLAAFAIAIPLVLIEYNFSLRGNRAAAAIHGLTALQILSVTLCFYFVNLYILNAFVLHHPLVLWRDVGAFLLIIVAFWISTNN